MMSEQLRQTVVQAIAATQLSPYKYYHLCWWQRKIQCFPAYHTKEKHTVFFSSPGDILESGLSPYQWKLIETRIGDFCRDKKIRIRPKSGAEHKEANRSALKSKLQVTEFDCTRLKTLLARPKSLDSSARARLDKLQEILQNAEVVSPYEIPKDVITMNSTVRLKDHHSNAEMVLSVVFPADASVDTSFEHLRVSILSAVGLSIFGRRVGETVEGDIKVRELIYQPEAMGRFDL
jgi:regulator of nucleoside diphosphate kinase